MEFSEDDALNAIRKSRRAQACGLDHRPFNPDRIFIPETPVCDPPPPLLPDTFLPPPPPGEQFPVPQLPLPIELISPEAIATCPDPDYDCPEGFGPGEPVVIPAGAFTEQIYLNDLETLTLSELYRLFGEQPIIQELVDDNIVSLHDETLSAAQWDALFLAATSMELAPIQELRVRILTAYTTLADTAEAAAVSSLDCVHRNQPIWVYCDSEADGGYRVEFDEPELGEVPDLIIPACIVASSHLSQDLANAAALDEYIPTLSCVYPNPEVEVTCVDVSVIYDHEYSPAYQITEELRVLLGLPPGTYTVASLAELHTAFFRTVDSIQSGNQDGVTLIYRVTVPAGAFTSVISEADAIAQARAYGLTQLNCFFPSRIDTLTCCGTYTQSGVPHDVSTPVKNRITTSGLTCDQVLEEMNNDHADDVTNDTVYLATETWTVDDLVGLRVDMHIGIFTSATSQLEADELAQAHALQYLDCKWVSGPVECACVDGDDPAQGQHPDNWVWATEDLVELRAHLDTTDVVGTFAEEDDAIRAAVGAGVYGVLDTVMTSYAGPFEIEDLVGMCLASLRCEYCNDRREPICDLTYSLNGIDPGTPLSGPATPLPLVVPAGTTGVSASLTAGLAEDTICNSSPEIVADFADGLASVPPGNEEEDCIYSNLQVWVSCRLSDIVDANLSVEPGDLEIRTYAKFAGLAEMGMTLDSTNLLSVAQGVIRVSQSEALAAGYTNPVLYATKLALEMAKSFLQCSFANVPIALRCFAHVRQDFDGEAAGIAPESLLNTEVAIVYPPYYENPQMGSVDVVDTSLTGELLETAGVPVDPGKPGGLERPVNIEAGVFVSQTSILEANKLAFSVALLQTDCRWIAPCVAVYCGASSPLLNEDGEIFVRNDPPETTDEETTAEAPPPYAISLPDAFLNGVAFGDGRIGPGEAIEPLKTGCHIDLLDSWDDIEDLGQTSIIPPALAGYYYTITAIRAASEALQLNPNAKGFRGMTLTRIFGTVGEPGEEDPFEEDEGPLDLPTDRDPVWGAAPGSYLHPQTLIGDQSEVLSAVRAIRELAVQGMSYTDCYVLSSAMRADCGPGMAAPSTITTIEPPPMLTPIYAPGSVIAVDMERSLVRSYISQLDADMQAMTLGMSMLQCAFCNYAVVVKPPIGAGACITPGGTTEEEPPPPWPPPAPCEACTEVIPFPGVVKRCGVVSPFSTRHAQEMAQQIAQSKAHTKTIDLREFEVQAPTSSEDPQMPVAEPEGCTMTFKNFTIKPGDEPSGPGGSADPCAIKIKTFLASYTALGIQLDAWTMLSDILEKWTDPECNPTVEETTVEEGTYFTGTVCFYHDAPDPPGTTEDTTSEPPSFEAVECPLETAMSCLSFSEGRLVTTPLAPSIDDWDVMSIRCNIVT